MLDEFEKKLKEIVDSEHSRLIGEISKKLNNKENKVFCFATELYQKGGRWYDKWGVPDSVLDSIYILDKEKISREKPLNILFLHDIGYPSGGGGKDYIKVDMRETHMRQGPIYAAELFNFKDLNEEYMFSREDVGEMLLVLSRHDDHYILNETGKEDILHRDKKLFDLYQTFVDLDRIFVMNFISTYKDYTSKHTDKEPALFFEERLAYFFEPNDPEIEEIGIKLRPETCEKAMNKGKHKLLYLDTTKEVVKAHFKARKEELENGLFELVRENKWNAFEPYLADYVNGSIEAAKQGKSYDVLRYG